MTKSASQGAIAGREDIFTHTLSHAVDPTNALNRIDEKVYGRLFENQ